MPEKGSYDYFCVVALDGGLIDAFVFSFPLLPEGLKVEKSLSLLMNEL